MASNSQRSIYLSASQVLNFTHICVNAVTDKTFGMRAVQGTLLQPPIKIRDGCCHPPPIPTPILSRLSSELFRYRLTTSLCALKTQPSFAVKLDWNGLKPCALPHASLRCTLEIHSCYCGELASCCTAACPSHTPSISGLGSGFEFNAMIACF